MKQNRPGHEGSKPSSGYSNPEGGTRWEGESRRLRTFVSCMCCREPKLMRAAGVERRGNLSRIGFDRRLGFAVTDVMFGVLSARVDADQYRNCEEAASVTKFAPKGAT